MSRLMGAAALVGALALTTTPALARDYAGTARNIVPSGQYGSVPVPAGAADQAQMYDQLTPLFDRVTDTDLRQLFKSEALNRVEDRPVRSTRTLRRGVTVTRDRFNVPFIKATSQTGAIWAAGWVIAEDRALLLEQARYNARVAAVDAPGLDALPLITGLRTFEPSARTEREIARQTEVLRAQGAPGRRLLRDIDTYVSGINAYLRRSRSSAKPWTRNDVYALNALKGEFLGQGGGDEPRRSQLLAGLQQRLGAETGRAVFDDLRNLDDPEHSVTVARRYAYNEKPADRSGNVVLDEGSWSPTPAATLTRPGASAASAPSTAGPANASNILMVAGSRSENGRPLFVGGPQIGYFYPGLTLEMDIDAPGMKVRGVTSAPFPGYMLIGRGEDFAWTLTSTGTDIIDVYAEELCGGDTRYRYKGRCRTMETFDAGVLKGSDGAPDQRARFRRTVHGPVIGYGTVDGRRVALASKRSSYGRDTVDQLFFQDLTLGRVQGVRSFFRAAAKTPQTFNAFYADDRDIGMFTTGRLPVRHPAVDGGLPTKGTGEYEWRGFLPTSRHAQGIQRDGVMVNWNNAPARGWINGDTEWGYGSVSRNELLEVNLAKRAKHTLASVTGAMNAAATQDPRATDVVSVLSAVLRGGAAPTPRALAMLDQLEAWRDAGGSRLDLDGDGKIDHPGAAAMDRAWPKLADAAMAPVLGPQLGLFASFRSRFDLPPSGMAGGWQNYLDKDLRTQLGAAVRGPYRTRFCGAGDLARCRADLWAALDAAGAELEAEQGPDVAAWRSDAERERIRFVPGLLPTTMRYTNRPNGIQQVISFDGHRRRPPAGG